MKFLGVDLIINLPNPVTGVRRSDHDRLIDTVRWAEYAEEVGFDAVAIGERHARPFLASAPPVVLSHIAAKTSKVKLLTGVTVLPVLDPFRAAEDYATLDHLSEGRLELIIGKGNDPYQHEFFGYDLADQWARNAENFELLHALWNSESVTWSGTTRPPLVDKISLPRPHQRQIPIWHGSASSTESTELAAKWGAPLFSANGFHPLEKYATLVDHYRERYEAYGHGPASSALVGAGAGGLYVTSRSQDAIETYRPIYSKFLNSEAARHNKTPFTDLDDLLARGPALIGSPEQVIEKVAKYHAAFGHQVLSLGIEGVGVSEPEQKASLELFFAEVAPVLRREFPSSVWDEAPELRDDPLATDPGRYEDQVQEVALAGAGR